MSFYIINWNNMLKTGNTLSNEQTSILDLKFHTSKRMTQIMLYRLATNINFFPIIPSQMMRHLIKNHEFYETSFTETTRKIQLMTSIFLKNAPMSVLRNLEILMIDPSRRDNKLSK